MQKNVQWFQDRFGNWWGKPQSWCKDCLRASQRARSAEGLDSPDDLEREGLERNLSPAEGQWEDLETEEEAELADIPIGARLGPPPSDGETSKPDPGPHPFDDPNWLRPEDVAALNHKD